MVLFVGFNKTDDNKTHHYEDTVHKLHKKQRKQNKCVIETLYDMQLNSYM